MKMTSCMKHRHNSLQNSMYVSYRKSAQQGNISVFVYHLRGKRPRVKKNEANQPLTFHTSPSNPGSDCRNVSSRADRTQTRILIPQMTAFLPLCMSSNSICCTGVSSSFSPMNASISPSIDGSDAMIRSQVFRLTVKPFKVFTLFSSSLQHLNLM